MMPDPQAATSARPLCIHGLLEAWAGRTPEAVALAAPGRAPLTFGRLLQHMAYVIATLNAAGIGRGERVALALPDGPAMAAAFIATAAGATCVPLNPSFTRPEFELCLSELRVAALVLEAGSHSPARTACRALSIPVFELSALPGAEAGLFRLEGGGGRQAAASPGPAGPEDIALVLNTSGTTARPKTVPLTQGQVCSAAQHIAAGLRLTPADRSLNVSPLFHTQGLISALLSGLASGGSVICTAGFEADDFFDWLRSLHPTWYTASPTIHRAVVSAALRQGHSPGHGPEHSLRFIRSASAHLPPPLMAQIEALFGVPVVESYSLTEVASLPVACTPLPPGRRRPGSVGLPGAFEVAVVGEAWQPLGPGTVGEIAVRGPGVISGYEGDQEENATAFSQGWMRTGDQGYLDGDGYLFLTGRIREVINRGGEKIAPREVDEALLAHPAVADAAAFAAPHATLGEDVAAAVVLREGVQATGEEIRRFVAERLAPHKVPRQVILVREMPKGPTGKLRRSDLAARLGQQMKGEFVAPRDDIERQLAAIWQGLLKDAEAIGVRDDFFHLGGDSLLATQMLAAVNRQWQRGLPIAAVLNATTIEQLAGLLRQESVMESATGSRPGLVALQPAGPNPPFFCVAGYMGDLMSFRLLGPHLAPDQPLYALSAWGPDWNDLPWTSLSGLAAFYVAEMRRHQAEGPYLLGGLSFGGVIAFEMGRQLLAQGQRVALLALLDTAGPALMRTRQAAQESARMQGMSALGKALWAARPPVGRWSRRLAWRLCAGLGRPVPYPLRERHAREVCAAAVKGYFPEAYRGRLTLFRATEGYMSQFGDPLLGWEGLASDIDIQEVPGDHITMFREPHVQRLAERLRACLDAATG
jgi:acyl-CoA synthetase (AMP-forming)/AMP-acid ligase II/thioesterase domain-containing protein